MLKKLLPVLLLLLIPAISNAGDQSDNFEENEPFSEETLDTEVSPADIESLQQQLDDLGVTKEIMQQTLDSEAPGEIKALQQELDNMGVTKEMIQEILDSQAPADIGSQQQQLDNVDTKKQAEQDDKPCAAVVCMSDLKKALGQACDDSIKAYFDIKKYNKRRQFSIDKTIEARGEWLDQCQEASSKDKKKIQGLFGHLYDKP